MTNGNEPIYPIVESEDAETMSAVSTGLTKREYFAGLAMQGMIVADTYPDDEQIKRTALKSVQMADALLIELAKEK